MSSFCDQNSDQFSTGRLLIAGTASDVMHDELFRNVRNESDVSKKIFDQCNMNRIEFDKESFVEKYRNKNLQAIILVEPLQPRPTCIVKDLENISFFVKKNVPVYVLFYYSKQSDWRGLKGLRDEFEGLIEFFGRLEIKVDFKNFLQNNIWLWGDCETEKLFQEPCLSHFFVSVPDFSKKVGINIKQITIRKYH